MIGIKHNIPEIVDKLKRIRLLIDGGWQDEAVNLMMKGQKYVRLLTPKSRENKYQHLRDGWFVWNIGKGGKDRIPLLSVIYNKFTHNIIGKPLEHALLKTGNNERQNYTVLDILEYGSRAHKIKPTKKKVLKFVIDTKNVFSKGVDHPGTKPYGMVRLTRIVIKEWLKKLQKRWARKIKKEFKS